MVFHEGSNVSFWITPQQLVVTKFSQCDDQQLKDKTKTELLGNPKFSGVDVSVVNGKTVG